MKNFIFKRSPWVLVFEQKSWKQTLSSEEMVRRKIIENAQLWEEQTLHKEWWLFSNEKNKLKKKLTKTKFNIFIGKQD